MFIGAKRRIPLQARGSASWLLVGRLCPSELSNRFAGKFQPERLVQKPVQDRLAERRVSDMLIPVFWLKLGGKNAGRSMIPVVNEVGDFPGVSLGERFTQPFIDD